MDVRRLYNCVRVLVALQCLELVWSYSILIDTLKTDQQIENSLGALIQSQENQLRVRRQAQDPQYENPDLAGSRLDKGQDPSQDGVSSDGGSMMDTVGDQGSNMDSVDSHSIDPQSDHSDTKANDMSAAQDHSDQNQDMGNQQDPSTDPSQSDVGSLDSGYSDMGSQDVQPAESGGSDTGSSDGNPSDSSGSHDQVSFSRPQNLRGNWNNPLYMTREGELPPMALPMTSAETGEAPVALPLTGSEGQGHPQPYGFHGSSHSETGNSDMASEAQSSESGGESGSVDTVPLEAQEGQPVALPQTQAQAPARQQPVAMPQRQGKIMILRIRLFTTE